MASLPGATTSCGNTGVGPASRRFRLGRRFANRRDAGSSAFVSVLGSGGESPPQVCVLRPVADRNCVAARRGGEHRKANGQSVTQVNSIRPYCLASLLDNGEAQTGTIRKSRKLKGNVGKRSAKQSGGWRRNDRKSKSMKQRDLSGTAGVQPSRRPCRRGREEPPLRSQRSHSSVEAG